RHLYLATQLFELGRPVVVALNMTDVAAKQGVTIDAAKLGGRLGTPVVPIQANRARGLDRLAEAVLAAADGPAPPRVPFPEAFEREAEQLAARAPDAPEFFVRRALA